MTLDADTHAIVRRLMRDKRMTFKQAVNEAIRAGARGGRTADPFRMPAHDLGQALVPVEKALRLAADLEDEEIIRKIALRK